MKKSNSILAVSLVLAIIVLVSTVLVFKNYGYRSQNLTESQNDEDIISFNGSDYIPNKDITTFLVIGLDTFTADDNQTYNDNKQADFLVLFVFNNDKKEYSALHINRDTMTDVNILALDGTRADVVKEQIALAHTEGNGKEISCRNTADSVSKLLLGTNVDYYASFTMDSVPIINDSVGGVTVTIGNDMTAIDSAFKEGEQVKLNGKQALEFVRARGGLTDSTNLTRMTRQRNYMTGLFAAVHNKLGTDRDYLEETFLDISDDVITNRSVNQLKKLSDKFYDYEFAGIFDIKGEAKVGEKFMEFYPDKEALEKTVIQLFYKKK